MIEDIQQQFIRDLVVESTEGLDQFDRDLLALENGAADGETLHRIFRTVHTIKGSSGCLGLRRIERVAHAGENLLSLMREGRLVARPELLTKLFRYSDALRRMLTSLDPSGVESEDDNDSLIADLNALHVAATGAEALSAEALSDASEVGSSGLFSDEDEEDALAPAAPEQDLVAAPAALEAGAPVSPAGSDLQAVPASPASDSAIRVDVGHLDSLMNLVGELVLARNQIIQYAATCGEPALLQSAQQLNMITMQLQENIMKTRMQPVGNVWAKFPRIVRDLAMELGKRVSLVLEGAETEMDRTILEAIKDPLTHVVRNAIDHGLETPDARGRAGKPPEGQLKLRAFHEGGQVIIEIGDDGAGIDRERVIRKAIDGGLIQAEESARLTDREVFALVFLPGFSTAERVTSLSGRGVGMDVVKKNIERIGGTVAVQSERGRSTTISIRIPLTLAIIPALIIRCAGTRYAIPRANLVELVRLGDDAGAVEYLGESSVYRLRGNLLPLAHLREQLRLGREDQRTGAPIFLLVLQVERRQFGLVVDSILDTEEIVVKPLGKELQRMTAYAGATIMGDGQVALILDIPAIAREAKLLDDANRGAADGMADYADRNDTAGGEMVLVVGTGNGRRAAIPLSSVVRLEEFQRSAIEQSGDLDVIQYRGQIMPLVGIDGQFAASFARDPEVRDSIQVVVYNLDGRSFGLVVERVLDIVEHNGTLQRSRNRPGILGSAVLQERVTDFLDVPVLLANSSAAVFAGLFS